MAPQTVGSHGGRLVVPGLFDVILNKYQRFQSRIPILFNTKPSRRQYEESYSMGGLGSVPTKAEAVLITLDSMLPGYYKQTTHTAYALQVEMTRELVMFDLYGVFQGGTRSKVAESLAESFTHTRELLASRVFNSGDATTYHTVGDAGALFATDHALLGGGTYSNLPTAADLAEASLEAAITLLDRMVNDQNQPVMLKAKYLVVPPDLKFTAKKLVRSAFEPETGNNAVNPIVDENLQVVEWAYLTDTDAWFLVAVPEQHDVIWFDVVKPEFTADGDFETEDSKLKGYMMCSTHINDWRGMVKNTGA